KFRKQRQPGSGGPRGPGSCANRSDFATKRGEGSRKPDGDTADQRRADPRGRGCRGERVVNETPCRLARFEPIPGLFDYRGPGNGSAGQRAADAVGDSQPARGRTEDRERATNTGRQSFLT